MSGSRLVSAMRPTGWLHLGHYHGVLQNWLTLQDAHECYFFIADWHALTTHYEDPRGLKAHTLDMLTDWLAAGVDPEKATLFAQSAMPEHAELHVLLSMGTPLSWLERVPTYKDQQDKLKDKDLATYGFLGYPLLQSADILLYRPTGVPVGADQVPHIEITREIARRFNHLYGREWDATEKRQAALEKVGKKAAKQYSELARRYQEQGDSEALSQGRAWVDAQHNLSAEDRERLLGGLDGSGRVILLEPEALLTKDSKMPGLDGQKMSKSYGNAIALREEPDRVRDKIRRMPTDPARVRRADAGEPARCPVYALHEVYSSDEVKAWAQAGCRSAAIGCIDCKTPLIDAVNALLAPMRERAAGFSDPLILSRILEQGAERARTTAQATLNEVRASMGLIGRWG